MARFEYYGKKGLPKVDLEELKGKLIVIEGTDGVGRSTHIGLLKQWLENNGHAVLDTGMTRSALAGEGLKAAKEGHTLGWLTMTSVLRHRLCRPPRERNDSGASRRLHRAHRSLHFLLMARALLRAQIRSGSRGSLSSP